MAVLLYPACSRTWRNEVAVWREADLREECCDSVTVTVELVSMDSLWDRRLGRHSANPASSQLIGGVLLEYRTYARVVFSSSHTHNNDLFKCFNYYCFLIWRFKILIFARKPGATAEFLEGLIDLFININVYQSSSLVYK